MQSETLRCMDAGAKAWLLRTVRKEYWRVCKLCDLEDLIQDGFMLWALVIQRYPTATRVRHRMALFMRIFYNHIHQMSKHQSRQPDLTLACEMSTPDGELMELEVLDEETATLAAKLATAPVPVQKVMQLYSTEAGRRKLRAPYRIYGDGTRETFNERLCRLVGMDARTGIDIPLLIKACLG